MRGVRDKRGLERLSAVARHNQAQRNQANHQAQPGARKTGTVSGTGKGQPGTGPHAVGSVETPGYVAEQLRLILSDPNGSTASKASAARTLAEIEGLIGRHQQAPARTQDKGLGELTRAELVQELDRLRALVQAP